MRQETTDGAATSSSFNGQRLAVINPQNIQFAALNNNTLISPLTDDQGVPVNSKIDKRHTMFANEIKKHVNDHNATLAKQSNHQR